MTVPQLPKSPSDYVYWGDRKGYGRPRYWVHDHLPCRLAAALEGHMQLFRHTTGNNETAHCMVCKTLLGKAPKS